ncbi:MAG: hypothetical protein ACKOSO_01215, partial [Actinomycetota bacterium]
MRGGPPDPATALARWHRALADAGHAAPLPAERVPVAEAAGRVLAEDVAARRAAPPVGVAASEGNALRAADTPGAPVRVARGDGAVVATR